MTLDRYLQRQFAPIFIAFAALSSFLFLLIDLFANLVRYLNNEIPTADIARMSLFYLPQAFAYAQPLSLLFAAAYTLGHLQARNELTSIFAAGIPFRRFCLPLLLFGVIASLFSFLFEDIVVIPTVRIKNELTRLALRQFITPQDSDIVIRSEGGRIIYWVDFYDHVGQTITGLSIVEQDDRGGFVSLIRAPRASWNGKYWELVNPMIWHWDDEFLAAVPLERTDRFTEDPDIFRRSAVRPEELRAGDLNLLADDLRRAGLPFGEAKSRFFRRFSFSSVSFIVMILSISMGGRFRKNTLLLCLLSSIAAAATFYVIEMITMTMARLGYVPPLVGAWFPVAFFVVIGVLLLGMAKT